MREGRDFKTLHQENILSRNCENKMSSLEGGKICPCPLSPLHPTSVTPGPASPELERPWVRALSRSYWRTRLRRACVRPFSGARDRRNLCVSSQWTPECTMVHNQHLRSFNWTCHFKSNEIKFPKLVHPPPSLFLN